MPLPFVTKARNPPSAPKSEGEGLYLAWDYRSLKGQAVGDSEDMRRILALPRRPRPSDAFLKEVADYLKAELGTGATSCRCREMNRSCCSDLLPTQAWALYEATEVGGILGPIGVGHGKTLLDLLVPVVVNAKTAVLLLPPPLKKQFLEADWDYYGQHWKLPNLAGAKTYWPGRPFLHILAFSELSGAKNTNVLEQLNPDIIVVDEAHNLRNGTAARTKRFMRFFKQKPEARLFCWSGTLTSKSLRDYALLSKHSLGQGSPVPLHWPAVEEWASALDPSDFPSPPGHLLKLGGKTPRDGLMFRLTETAGVISSGDSASCQASLVISERVVAAPSAVQVALDGLEESWQRPDGEELIDALSKAKCARELSCGFFYRWRWPKVKGEKQKIEVIEKWLLARKNWHKELREKLKRGGAHMDSPLLLTQAAIRWQKGYVHIERNSEGEESRRVEVPPKKATGPRTTWDSQHWSEWERLRETVVHETEAVWLSDFLVEDTLAWLSEGPGLAWYEFNAFADRVLNRGRDAGLTYCGPGETGTGVVLSLRGTERALVSIRSHGTGRNLQSFDRNLVANPPSGGDTWEQLIGRTHRTGQTSDEVSVAVYRHTEVFRQAVETARDLSEHIQGTFGATQRLASVARWDLTS